MIDLEPDAGQLTSAVAGRDTASISAPGRCRVVVGVDDTQAGIAALRRGLELAATADAPLVAVRVWDLGLPRHGGRRRHHRHRRHLVLFMQPDLPCRQAVQLAKNALRAAGGARCHIPVAIMAPNGERGAVLSSLATGNDLRVLGTSAGNGLRHAVHGSVGAYCLRHPRCKVITVGNEPKEFGHAR